MKRSNATWVVVWFALSLVMPLYNAFLPENTKQEDERSKGDFIVHTASKFKSILESEKLKEGIPDFAENAGGLLAVGHRDFNKPAKEVVKDFGDAVIRILSAGLSHIPGVEPLIGRLVPGIWGEFSFHFGGHQGKSQIELLINDINYAINGIKEMNDKLANIIRQATEKLIYRNEYVCNKYSVISRDFVVDIKNNRSIKESLQMEMIAYVNDCDNFLKDTSTSFVHSEFADVLWIPSAISTFVRVAFLTEVSNYGVWLKLDDELIRMFWREMKAEILQQFAFYADGVASRVKEPRRSTIFRVTTLELEGCRLQRQLLYLDREMYPYGIPKHFVITGYSKVPREDAELNMASLNVSGNSKPQHIQIFYNDLDENKVPREHVVLNCFSGPDPYTRPIFKLSFHVTYVPNKWYQVRVMYFAIIESDDEPHEHDRKVTVTTENNVITIHVDTGSYSTDSSQRFVVRTSYHDLFCSELETATKGCTSDYLTYIGNYVVENVISFAVPLNGELEGKIVIEVPGGDTGETIILGAELIILNPQ